MDKETSNPLSINFEEERRKQEYMGKIGAVIGQLAEPVVQHTSIWGRCYYLLDNAQNTYDQLMASSLRTLIQGYINPRTGAEYATTEFDGVAIEIEEMDHRKNTTIHSNFFERSATLYFGYSNAEMGGYHICLRIIAGDSEICGFIHENEFADAGYIGHSHRDKNASADELQILYQILQSISKEDTIKEEPFEEQMGHIIELSPQGQKKFYNSQTREWEVLLDDRL